MKKKIIGLVLALIMIVPMTTALAETMYVDMPIGNSANLRVAPTTEADVCGVLDNGAAVEVIETSGTWAKIENGSEEAWIQLKYLNIDPSKKETGSDSAVTNGTDSISDLDFSSFVVVEPFYTYIQAKIPGAFVNLRWAPSKDAAVAHRINDGGEVIVYATGDKWAQVMDSESGYIGFVQSEYLINGITGNTETVEE